MLGVPVVSADEKQLLDDADYDEEGYGPTAVRRADMAPLDKLLEAEQKLLFFPPLVAGKFMVWLFRHTHSPINYSSFHLSLLVSSWCGCSVTHSPINTSRCW